MNVIPAVLLAVVAAACSTSPAATPSGPPVTQAPPTSSPVATAPIANSPTATLRLGGDRPFDVFVPDSYDGSQPMPLLMLLHWFGGTGDAVEAEYKFEPRAQERSFLYVRPNATLDSDGSRSWSATDACCHWSPPVDDSAYLESVLDEIKGRYNVDENRVYLFGISNGGFMAYRMACDYSHRFAAMVSVVGSTVMDRDNCPASEPVSVLEIHGTDDDMVPYDGGQFVPGRPFPSVEQTVADWAALNGCDGMRSPTGRKLDLESSLDGPETVVSAFGGCPDGVDVELWTVHGGDHTLDITPGFVPAAVDFLLAHAKP